MNRPISVERRSDRTRERIKTAFSSLVFESGFETVSVEKVIRTASIARSTFYEHFSSKEDVLRACMDPFFSTVADCVVADEQPEGLHAVLDHMWKNRRLTDAIFTGQPRSVLARNQAGLVEIRLCRLADGRELAMPLQLASVQISEAQLSLIESWLRGRAFASIQQVASGLHRTSRASALALL